MIADGELMLALNYRRFAGLLLQPYAETGPIFLHQAACQRYDETKLPAWFIGFDAAAIRGYGANDWMRYETGVIVRGQDLAEAAATILENENAAYVHIRSKFGCFQCRIDRA